MSESADGNEFEVFQGRVFQTALVLWLVALVACLAIYRDYSAVLGGIVMGGAASLAALRFKVWALRRLTSTLTPRQVRLQPWLSGGGRLAISAAAVALAVWLSAVDDARYLVATVLALFLGNAAVIIQAVREARRSSHYPLPLEGEGGP